ncbi:MAG: hypothetical protein LW807_05625 [Proteobacteria bacterium]|nr:hypothetical protein [Pseudomonadota bacterium]
MSASSSIIKSSISKLKSCLSGHMFSGGSYGFSDLLMYAKMIEDGVILQTDGSFLAAFWFRGADLETSTSSELAILSSKLNAAFNLLGSGWLFHIDTLRYKADDYVLQHDCHFTHKLSKLIDEERRQIYKNSGNHYENAYAISFTYKPKIDLGSKLGVFFKQKREPLESESLESGSLDYSYYLELFKNKLTEVAGLVNSNLNLEQMKTTDLLSYINWCLTSEKMQLNIPKNYGAFLKHFLASKDLVGGENPKVGDQYLRAITVMGFPSDSYAGILDKLNYLDFEYRFNTRFILIDQYESNKIIERIANLWYQKRISAIDTAKMSLAIDSNIKINQNAQEQYHDAGKAQAINDKAEAKFGYYTATILIFDNDEKKVEQNAIQVRNILREMGFQSQIERYHTVEAYLGSLPGYSYANIRKWLIHTQNLADLMPSTAIWSGLKYNPCGLYKYKSPPLFYAMTTGNTPLRLSLHVADNGHTLIVGPTGSGKSTLLNFIIAQHFRYADAQIFMFDKNKSSLPLCYGLEGEFFDIGEGGNYFQPLGALENEIDFEFAANWIEELCILNGMAAKFDDTHRVAIRKGLKLMRSEAHIERRTLSYFRHLVQDYDQAVAIILDGFCSESRVFDSFYESAGFIAKLFDADIDKLSQLDNNFIVFEMAKLMELGDRVIIPALRYFIHAINKRVLSNKPTLIIFDESFLFFKHSLFREKIIDWLKTMRKFNVAVIFATQELADLFKYEDLLSSLKTNCATKIFLPNIQAASKGIYEQYEDMGLNEKQINLISHASRGEYFYVSSLGIRKFSLDLQPDQIAFAFIAKTAYVDIKKAIELKATNPHDFIDMWSKYVINN